MNRGRIPSFAVAAPSATGLNIQTMMDAGRAQFAGMAQGQIKELGMNNGDETHDWFVPDFIGYECCRRCGIVRRADRQNNPCRGPARIEPRATPPRYMPQTADEEFQRQVAEAQARYDALTPEQRAAHDYAQRRSFVRGMCPDNRDYGEWCKVVDRLMPPLRPKP